MNRFSAYWTPALGAAICAQAPIAYDMTLVGEDAKAAHAAVNQGIDSHLEACNVPARGDSFKVNGSRLECVVSRESLPVLVRRLLEAGDENGLASGICSTLGIELV